MSTTQALEAVGEAVGEPVGGCRIQEVMKAALQELSETICREAKGEMFEVRVWEGGELISGVWCYWWVGSRV